MSWNKAFRQILASGSADHSVKLWDVTTQSCKHTFTHHTDKAIIHGHEQTNFNHTHSIHNINLFNVNNNNKMLRNQVQSVAWHPSEAWLLATGSFDRSVCVLDCRAGNAPPLVRASVPSDVESLAWDPFESQHLYVSLEDGQIGVLRLNAGDEVR